MGRVDVSSLVRAGGKTIAVTIFSLVGIAISIVSLFLAYPNKGARYPLIYFGCLILHLAGTIGFWQISLNNPADAIAYYEGIPSMMYADLQFGTVFVVQFVQLVKTSFGATMLDLFFLFQSFGMIGIAIMLRATSEIAAGAGLKLTPILLVPFLLPGLHLWTSGIGKDGPVFLGVSLTVWAFLQLNRRVPVLIAGIFITALFRPHIAAICLLALLITLASSRRVGCQARIALLALSAGSLAVVLPWVSTLINTDVSDPGSVVDFLENRVEYGATSSEGSGMGDLPWYLRLPSLLFRPMFYDAGGTLGLLASVENLMWLVMVGVVMVRTAVLVRLSSTLVHVKYCLILSSALILLLTLVTYNVGLGMRQKIMVLPPLLVLYSIVILHRRYTKMIHRTRNDEVTQTA
jgi:hypothetical protein